jgi:hypothetical protein
MFFPGSRYHNLGSYSITRRDGKTLRVTRLPLATRARVIGFHRRLEEQRLDHIASHYLADATAFWRLCDANGTIVPDTLAAAPLVGIPAAEK